MFILQVAAVALVTFEVLLVALLVLEVVEQVCPAPDKMQIVDLQIPVAAVEVLLMEMVVIKVTVAPVVPV